MSTPHDYINGTGIQRSYTKGKESHHHQPRRGPTTLPERQSKRNWIAQSSRACPSTIPAQNQLPLSAGKAVHQQNQPLPNGPVQCTQSRRQSRGKCQNLSQCPGSSSILAGRLQV